MLVICKDKQISSFSVSCSATQDHLYCVPNKEDTDLIGAILPMQCWYMYLRSDVDSLLTHRQSAFHAGHVMTVSCWSYGEHSAKWLGRKSSFLPLCIPCLRTMLLWDNSNKLLIPQHIYAVRIVSKPLIPKHSTLSDHQKAMSHWLFEADVNFILHNSNCYAFHYMLCYQIVIECFMVAGVHVLPTIHVTCSVNACKYDIISFLLNDCHCDRPNCSTLPLPLSA